MRRLLLTLTLLLLPLQLAAQSSDRAILLAPNGTLYTVDSKTADLGDTTSSARYLVLHVQTGENVIESDVPASMTGGNNWQPELAFDAESNTLFVFWVHSQNSVLATNELLFCSYQNGRWNDATSIEDVPYHFRYNLRIGVTNSVLATSGDGSERVFPGLTVHAAWWDDSAFGEGARYAMLSIENGLVTSIERHDLTEFVNRGEVRLTDFSNAVTDIMRHPVVFESPNHDTIDIVFGEKTANLMHRVTLKPVLNAGRIRVPIGVRETSYPAPRHKMTSESARVSAVSTPSEKLALFYTADGAVRYLIFENGRWAADNAIVVTPNVSADAAVSALRRMVRGD